LKEYTLANGSDESLVRLVLNANTEAEDEYYCPECGKEIAKPSALGTYICWNCVKVDRLQQEE